MEFYPPGFRIAGRYEVASRPLMGGMGIVYICYDHREDRYVALKTFKPEYLPDRAGRDRFLREGTHWVDLGTYPHVVRCYEVERVGDGTEVYLALELVAKEQGRDDASLRAWLTPGQPLPPETALLFALQIARGMKHAADSIPGFVHRDLKPENVLVGADRLPDTPVNRLRVTDFGLAAVLQGAGTQAESTSGGTAAITTSQFAIRSTQLTHGIAGTPLYMAPEQWRGEPVGVYTDVYALGCILYEMLAGQPAVAGRSVETLQRAHCAGDLRPLPADLPEPACILLDRCLALEPGERPGSWEEVEEDLASALEAVTGQRAPALLPPAAPSRAERVQAGWSHSEMGGGYLDIGKAEVAAAYFERARAAGAAEGERALEGAALGNLGSAYAALGNMQQAIVYLQQAIEIQEETGYLIDVAGYSMNVSIFLAQKGLIAEALPYAERAAKVVAQIGHAEYAQRAQGLVTKLQGGGAPTTTPAQILQQFDPVIEAVVEAAHGHSQARAAVEQLLPQLEQKGWRIAEPIHRIWAGERDQMLLTAGLDDADSLIVHETLKRLRE
jgi:serine/threonine protein kinase